jgi:hypothetical protein
MSELTGTWRLVETRAWNDDEQVLPPPFGPLARGIVVFEDNNRMMCVLVDGRTEMPAGEIRQYSTYTGWFTFDGTTLTTRVDASVDPDRIGSDQVRGVRFDGKRVVLKPPARPNYGGIEHRELFWERIA